jgi:arylsulfatase A-like enzyme
VQGADGFETPFLDQLAAEGARFTDFYVAQPVCSASRAALLTGCYPNRIGISGALNPDAEVGIHAAETTLAELCREAGYATAAFGKWHLGSEPDFLPTRHGFDEFYGIPYSNDMWPNHPESPKAWPPLPLLEGEKVVELNPDQSRFTSEFTRRGVAFIESAVEQGRPFFLYLAHPMPHVPLFASDAFVGGSEQGLYGDVIQEIDASVGQLMEVLERTGQADNTLFLFSSDNGPWLSYGNHAGSTGPLREGKGTTFEGGVRVPFIARWPGKIPAGLVCSEPAMTIDVYPTVAGLLGESLEGQRPIDGQDIWPLLSGEPGAVSPHEALFFYYNKNDLQAMRVGKWKLHFPHGYRSMVGRELGADGIPGKYDYSVKTGVELYDLEADIGEEHDVSKEYRDLVKRFAIMADVMRRDLGDKLTSVEGDGRRKPGRVRDSL